MEDFLMGNGIHKANGVVKVKKVHIAKDQVYMATHMPSIFNQLLEGKWY
jgi:hypothetical protein